MSRLEIEAQRRLGRLVVLSLRGRCTLSMVGVLREALATELDRGPSGLLLDAAQLEEIEGPGFYEIVLADRHLRARHGALVVYSLPDVIAASIRQADLLDEVDLQADFASARKAVEQRIRKARHAEAASRILTRNQSSSLGPRRTIRRQEAQRIARLAARILC